MSATVVIRVKVPDWNRFIGAWRDAVEANPAPRRLSSRVLQRETDPNEVLIVEEWESHDAWHEFGEEVGPEFTQKSGTAGVEMDDTVWKEAWTG